MQKDDVLEEGLNFLKMLNQARSRVRAHTLSSTRVVLIWLGQSKLSANVLVTSEFVSLSMIATLRSNTELKILTYLRETILSVNLINFN